MKFFIVENNQQAGPFSIEEMATRGVVPSTPVWREGMADWTPACNVPELSSLFSGSPVAAAPRQDSSQAGAPMDVCPKTWLIESILVTIFCCLPFGIVGIVKASSVSSKFSMGDFAGARKASADAKKWTTIGLICGIAWLVIYFIFITVTGALAAILAL